MKGNSRRGWLLAFAMLVVFAPVEGLAQELNSLYETTENASLRLKKPKNTRSATASLFGELSLASPICPSGLTECYLVVIASDAIDVDFVAKTGHGPVWGDVFVVTSLPWDNRVDAPEGTVAEGSLKGQIQLAGPLGSISGTWDVRGAKGGGFEKFRAGGSFTGTFYLPFQCGTTACYLINGSPTPVTPGEYAIGFPAVRLAIEFTD